MLKRSLVLALIGGVMFFSFTLKDKEENLREEDGVQEAEAVTGGEIYLLDPKKSKVEWAAVGATKQHNGTVDFKSGQVVIDTKQIKSGFFYIDMKSMKDADIKDDGFNKQLIDHLKGEDFFNVVKFGQSTFKITKATRLDVPAGQNNYEITGDLMIKSVTKSISFPALVTFGKSNVTAKAETSIDRTQWGITYNSGNYFKDLGDKLIEDNIKIKLNFSADIK